MKVRDLLSTSEDWLARWGFVRTAILGNSKAKPSNARMMCADFTCRRLFSISTISVDFSVIMILAHRRTAGIHI